jgi:hypothetical protein
MPDLNWVEKRIFVHGVDLIGYALLVPGGNQFTFVEFDHPPEWQSDPDVFFDGVDRTKIAIPKRHGGRYYLCATIRCERSDNRGFQIQDRDNSYFFTYLTKNGDTEEDRLAETRISAAPVVNSSKTVIRLLWEGKLKRNDFLKLFIAQNGTILGETGIPISTMVTVWLTLRRLGSQKP